MMPARYRRFRCALLIFAPIVLVFATTGMTAPMGHAATRLDAPTIATMQTPTRRPPATPTPPIGERADRCEQNNRRADACAIAVDAVNGPFTFLPPGDQDYYRIDLGAPNGLQTTITVRSSGSLDLLTTITRDDGAPLATISSPAISTTLAADVAGGVIIRVENRDAGDPSGQTYNVEVRRTLPPPPPSPVGDTQLPPDKLENNWNPITAAPIAVGVIYDLNFVCPVSWGCAGGDHDYLKLPVKKGLKYLICTFDLGPGVDTVLELFWGTSDTPIAGNDDARPSSSFLSVIRWVAPSDGAVIIRIAPRTGGTTPIVFDDKASTYRFAVALSDSDLAKQIEARIAEQTHAPTPTPRASASVASGNGAGMSPTAPTPTPNATPVAGAPPASGPAVAAQGPSGMTTRGQAIVIAKQTAFRIAPNPNASLIQMLAAERVVTLAGQYNGLWVSVTTADSVLPGWVLGTDLRRLSPDQATATISATGTLAASPTSVPGAPASIGTPAPSPTSGQPIAVRPIAPVPADPAPAPPPRSSLTVSVTVVAAPVVRIATPAHAASTPTPVPTTLLAGVRVQLVDAFGDLLAEAITDSDGQVALTHDVDAGQRVLVRLPAAGLEVLVDPRQPAITIALPPGGQP